MAWWDNGQNSLFAARSAEVYKDKERHNGPSPSQYSGSENSPTPFLPPVNPGDAWFALSRRLSTKSGRYLLTFVAAVILTYIWHTFPHGYLYRSQCGPACEHTLPYEDLPESRIGELRDTFAGYKHRGEECDISSLELHKPFGHVCPDRTSMLTAMSSGGRIGKDAPYVPRGCDMQWFSTREVCEILGRYSQVILVGDSMLRHVIGAMNILVREDLGYGGVTNWNFNEEERRECFCNNQFDVRDCSVQGIFSTADVVKHDPLSLVCPKIVPEWSMDLRIEQMVRYPIPEEERQRLERAIDSNPSQQKAFVLGHGLWNNLEIGQSVAWLDSVLDTIDSKLKARMHLRGRSAKRNLPVLLMTPNAAGEKKPDEWIITQGNKALIQFEHAMAVEAAKRRVDHLGTWNMSIQATLYDGVHMDMRGNLLKAMMVVNWLNLLEV
ncbi:hypothetical protein F4779DRAFT_570369 [Xylariaceae sp. FL0662B]|nr:hypothetical protein F4779DRAFT_570369 [Xylariaceae sp. FL0662B]